MGRVMKGSRASRQYSYYPTHQVWGTSCTPHALNVWSIANGTCHSSSSQSLSSLPHSSASRQTETVPSPINYYLHYLHDRIVIIPDGSGRRGIRLLQLPTKCQFINGPYTSSRFDVWYAVADDCSWSAEHNRAKLCTVHVTRVERKEVYLNFTEFLHAVFQTTCDRQPLWNVKTDDELFLDLNFIILRTNSSQCNINIKYIIYSER